MIKSGPSPLLNEVEAANTKVELSVLWDDFVLFSGVVDEFSIGDGGNLILPMEKHILIKDGTLFSPQPIELTREFSKAKFGNIEVRARLTQEGKKYPVPWFDNFNKFVYVGMSGVLHFSLLFLLAFFMPPLGLAEAEENPHDSLFLMQQYLNASAEREQEAKEDHNTIEDSKDDKEGGTGQRAIGEEGAMGNPNSKATNRRFAIAGPVDNKDIHISRESALRDAASFGLIGLINTGSGDPNAPTAPWGRDESLGADPFSARGNMWGSDIGEAFGVNGLGLSGIGEGGGGRAEGIGVGSVGTIGHGAGLGDKQGFGNGHGLLKSGHKIKDIKVRIGTSIVTGRIPAELILRIMRQSYGRFRFCYEVGLRKNPNLSGRIVIRFIIGRDGTVSNVANGGSDIADSNVISCILRSVYNISFPSPESGIVTILYPVVLIQN